MDPTLGGPIGVLTLICKGFQKCCSPSKLPSIPIESIPIEYSYGCPGRGCSASELPTIPLGGIPIEYSYGCPGRVTQPLSYQLFL
jgi:hypothetical protein